MAESFSFEEASKPIASGPESFSFEEASTPDVPSNKHEEAPFLSRQFFEEGMVGRVGKGLGERAARFMLPESTRAAMDAQEKDELSKMGDEAKKGLSRLISEPGKVASEVGANVRQMGKQMVEHPIDTAVTMLKGIVQDPEFLLIGGLGAVAKTGVITQKLNAASQIAAKTLASGAEGAAIMGGGELAAQTAERKPYDPTAIGTQATVGGVFGAGLHAGKEALGGAREALRRPKAPGESPPPSEAPGVATEPPTPPKTDASTRVDANLREAELATNAGKRLKEAAFMDTETGEYIPQGKGHDDMLKSNPRLVPGFLTEDNSFVTRKEAQIVAENQHADLLVKEIDPKEGLHSTDFGPERMDAFKPKDLIFYKDKLKELIYEKRSLEELLDRDRSWDVEIESINLQEKRIAKLQEQINETQKLHDSLEQGTETLNINTSNIKFTDKNTKSAVQELGIRTDNRKNFYQDLDKQEFRLAMLEQEMETRVDSLSTEEQFAFNKEIKDLEKKIEAARNEAPVFESKGQKQFKLESIPPEQRTVKEQQELGALKQSGEHNPTKLDWEDTQDLIRGAKTATEALQRIVDGSHASWPLVQLSKLLIKNQLLGDARIYLNDYEVPFKGKNAKPKDTILGQYDPTSHSIDMNKGGDVQTFLHETIHAAVYAMQKDGTHASAKAIKKLYEDYKNTTSKETQAGEYGLADEFEFIAEAFTNPKFQKLLSTRYMLDNPSKTMWQGFKDTVKDALGIKKGNQANSALDQILDHGAVLLEEGFVSSERTPSNSGKFSSEPSFNSSKEARDYFTGNVPSKGTAAPTPAVDPTRYDPRKVTDEADLKLKGKELYASKGADAAREFFTGYEKYKETWLNPVKEVEDFVEININNKMADERLVTNNSNDLKALVPDAVAREQVAIAIDAKKTDTLTGAAKEAADKYNGLMKDIGERALKEGVVKGLLENYVTHIVNWADMPKGALETFLDESFKIKLPSDKPVTGLSKEMATESRFGKERKIETFTQLDRVLADINRRIALAGKDFKLEVKTKDIAEIYKEYASSMEKAIENKKLVDNVLSIRNPGGESLIRRVTAEEPLPYGWQMINDRQFAGYAVHQDLAPALKFAFEARGNKIIDAIYNVSQITKRLNVVGSLFHAKSLMEVLSSAHTPIVTPVKEIVLGITDKLLGTEYSGIRKAINEFKRGGLGSSVDKWQRDGLVLETPSDVSKGIISATGKFADSMIGKFGPKTRILESALSATEKYTLGVFDKITWDYLHTGGKLMTAQAYLDKARIDHAKTEAKRIEKAKEVSDESLIAEAKKEADSSEKYDRGSDLFVPNSPKEKQIVFEEYYKKLKDRQESSLREQPFDEAAARKEIVSFVNKSFGGLNWFQEARPSRTPGGALEQPSNIVSQTYKKFSDQMAMAAYSPQGRKGLQILLFAPDWTISTIKAFTLALPKEMNPTKWHPIEGVKGMATPSTKADYARLYQFKTALTYLTLLNGINLAVSGRNIWENKDPTRIEFPDGTSMQAMKHAMEPYHWISDPDKTLTNKLGFIPKAAAVAATGLEYASPYAPKMVDPSVANRAKAIASMALPFQVTAGLSAPEGEGAKRALLGTIGLPVYGKTKEQRKADNSERAKKLREVRKQYKEREREKGRE